MFNIKSSDEIVLILKTLQKAGFESAIIAGGAVRDLYFNQMFRDVDIFIWDPDHSGEEISGYSPQTLKDPNTALDAWTNILKLDVKNCRFPRDEISFNYVPKYGKGTPIRISMVISVLRRLIPCEIIYTKSHPVEHLSNYFNIGLCKAYFDGTKFRFTPDFMRDARNKTLTVVGRDMSQEDWDRTIKEHIPRIQTRYPNFQVKVAHHNQQFLDSKKKALP